MTDNSRVFSTAVSIATLLAVMTLLSGCFSLDSTVGIVEDGSGRVYYRAMIDTEAVARLAAMAPDGTDVPAAGELCSRFRSGLIGGEPGDGVTVVPVDDGPRCGLEVTADVGPNPDPGAEVQRLLATAGLRSGTWTIEQNDLGGWHFAFDGLGQAMNDSLAMIAEQGGTGDLSAAVPMLAPSVELNMAVSVPGYELIGGNNADYADQGDAETNFHWNLSLADLPPTLAAWTAETEGQEASGEALVRDGSSLSTGQPPDAVTPAESATESSTAPAADASTATTQDSTTQDSGTQDSTTQDSSTDELAYIDDEEGNGGLLLGLGGLMLVLAGGGYVLVNRSSEPGESGEGH